MEYIEKSRSKKQVKLPKLNFKLVDREVEEKYRMRTNSLAYLDRRSQFNSLECVLQPLGKRHVNVRLLIRSLLLGQGPREDSVFTLHLLCSGKESGQPLVQPILSIKKLLEQGGFSKSVLDRRVIRYQNYTTTSFAFQTCRLSYAELLNRTLKFSGGNFSQDEVPEIDLFISCFQGNREHIVGGCRLVPGHQFQGVIISQSGKIAGQLKGEVSIAFPQEKDQTVESRKFKLFLEERKKVLLRQRPSAKQLLL